MNTEQLNRTLQLLRRTGDKAVVLDPASDHVFVMMDVDDYENLLDEADYPQSPNNDDDTKGSDEGDDPLEDYVLDDILPNQETPATPEHPTLTLEEMTEIAPEPVATKNRAMSQEDKIETAIQDTKSLTWNENETLKESVKPATILNEESLADVPNDEEEEKFYLEPVDEV